MSRIWKYIHFPTWNKTYNNRKNNNNAFQTCHDESGVLKMLPTEDQNNEKLNIIENLIIVKKAVFWNDVR